MFYFEIKIESQRIMAVERQKSYWNVEVFLVSPALFCFLIPECQMVILWNCLQTDPSRRTFWPRQTM